MFEQILLTFSFLLLPYISVRYLHFYFLSPCVVFQCFWILLGLIPYLIFVNILRFNLSADGLVFILVFLLFVTGGSWLVAQYRTKKNTSRSSRTTKYLPISDSNMSLLIKTIAVLSIFSILASSFIVRTNGLTLSLATLITTGSQFAELRNTELISINPLATGLQNISSYLNALLLGTIILPSILILRKINVGLLSAIILPVVSLLFAAVSQGQKGIVSLFVILVVSGLGMFFTYNDYTFIEIIKLTKTRLALGGLIALSSAILTGFVLPFFSRGYSIGSNEFELLFGFNENNPFLVYSIGHIHNFLIWYEEQPFANILTPRSDMPPLIYTFRDYVTMVLGIKNPLPPGLYDEYILGNIYTVFRGLIEDFGLIGSCAFAASIGFLSELSMYLYRYGKKINHFIGAAGLVVFYQASFQSYIASAFIWKTTLVLPIIYTAFFALRGLRPSIPLRGSTSSSATIKS